MPHTAVGAGRTPGKRFVYIFHRSHLSKTCFSKSRFKRAYGVQRIKVKILNRLNTFMLKERLTTQIARSRQNKYKHTGR